MPSDFCWSSDAGYSLCRDILKTTKLGYDPHTYQVEGVCKALDGIDVFAITPTGSGKTGFYMIYIHVLLAVTKNPSLVPPGTATRFPSNPCLILICPTITLQVEMADRMSTAGLQSLAINSHSREEAFRLRNEELWMTARKFPNVIIAGPEQLRAKEFENALADSQFYDRISGLGFDEVHLLNSWGSSFRKDFQQMGFLKARMREDHNPWILTTATCQTGRPFQNICDLLGLRTGSFHLIHRSNRRSEIQILVRELSSGLNGNTFPELDWILSSGRSVLVFAKTIALSFRLYGHLFRRAPPGNRDKRLRMYNSLNWESFNAKTRELLQQMPELGALPCIAIGTDTLSVGVDIPHCQDVVIILENEADADLDDILQKIGRAGRHPQHVQDPRGIIYITRTMSRSLASADLDSSVFGCFLSASCKTAVLDEIYDNPTSDAPCFCTRCSMVSNTTTDRPCRCSGCQPEAVPPPSTSSKQQEPTPAKHRLTKAMREYATADLLTFRLEIWRHADPHTEWMLPPQVFLPDSVITSILNSYHLLCAENGLRKLTELLQPHQYLTPHCASLHARVLSMQVKFDSIAIEKRAERAEKAKQKRGEECPPTDEVPRPKRAPTAYNIFLKETMETWRREHPMRAKEAYTEALKLWKSSPDNPKSVAVPESAPDSAPEQPSSATSSSSSYRSPPSS
ncbi:hypothetical protein EYR38_004735 [Pleurotus pulmonarius]|nr:hypothetical protein EYR38_004735 [Pleurotus pulmonarius]